ncbi:hypothetical protein ACFVAJ_11190 [Agromyces sp. NPDC057679]|uniref:hypothetical protein n=1 Tax=Agromyces sp. NPDC057679 TaxID=3346207 RepID=UPI00366B71E8
MSYQQPSYQPQQVIYQQIIKPPTNGVATTSMVFGIVGIVIGVWAWIPILGLGSAIIGFPLGLTAVITGHIGVGHANRMGGVGKSAAMTGLGLGYATVGIITLVTLFWIIMAAASAANNAVNGG